MPIQFTSKIEEDIHIFTVTGDGNSLENAVNYSTSLIAEAQQSNSQKILCDERGLELTLSTADIYTLAELTAKMLSSSSARIAVIYKPEYLEKCRFYETVTGNRGLLVHINTDYDEALAWLKKH